MTSLANPLWCCYLTGVCVTSVYTLCVWPGKIYFITMLHQLNRYTIMVGNPHLIDLKTSLTWNGFKVPGTSNPIIPSIKWNQELPQQTKGMFCQSHTHNVLNVGMTLLCMITSTGHVFKAVIFCQKSWSIFVKDPEWSILLSIVVLDIFWLWYLFCLRLLNYTCPSQFIIRSNLNIQKELYLTITNSCHFITFDTHNWVQSLYSSQQAKFKIFNLQFHDML